MPSLWPEVPGMPEGLAGALPSISRGRLFSLLPLVAVAWFSDALPWCRGLRLIIRGGVLLPLPDAVPY